MFLDFFVQKGHREVHSSSLLPANDPTLLFTNAGMNQFKDVFLGAEKRDYTRATSSQKCVRAGGKHNDLENVGFTNRHHTFFEMLGNFSFGDYFKQEAIAYAWELVTSPQWYAMAKDKLYVTIFRGEAGVPRDSEAYNLWLKAGVEPERIFELGMKENFWQMGDTGPCGPCSEIHYDMGVESSDKKLPECAAGECKFPCECGRYVEIWNLVFMQFDRNSEGVLNPLPKPSIDTGAGLERVAAVLQGVVSNYDTDLFVPLIERAAKLTGKQSKETEAQEEKAHHAGSLRVIADHSRAATFLISDGILPANEGRGYVLRKIIRRAIRHGRLLGQTQPFLYKMVDAVVKEMAGAYPELRDSAARVARIIEGEETRFANTVAIGLARLQALLDAAPEGILPGKEMRPGSPRPWKSRSRAPRPVGRVARRRPPRRYSRHCRTRSLKATARSSRPTARCSPSSTTARVCANWQPESRARSSSTTRRFTPSPAARLAIRAGSIRATTPWWWPRSKACTRLCRACARTKSPRATRSLWATGWSR